MQRKEGLKHDAVLAYVAGVVKMEQDSGEGWMHRNDTNEWTAAAETLTPQQAQARAKDLAYRLLFGVFAVLLAAVMLPGSKYRATMNWRAWVFP